MSLDPSSVEQNARASLLPLGDAVDFVRGITFKPEDKVDVGVEGSVVCMRTKNIQEDLDESDLIAVPESFVRREDQRLIDGDILISSANSWNLVGKCCKVSSLSYKATAGGFISIVRAKRGSLDPDYLYRWLSSARVQHTVRHLGRQTTNISNLPVDQFLELKIPAPPLPEQKRVAAILDKADAIYRKRHQAIDLADQLLRSIFLDLFSDPVTNPKGWPLYAIGNLCTIVRGSSPRPKGDSRYYGGPIPRLMVQDLTRDGKYVTPKIDSLTVVGAELSRPIDAGTVVMAVSGNVGLTAILAIDACIHDGFIAMKDMDESVIKPDFMVDLLMFLKSTHAAREAGAIFKNLTTAQIKEMEVPIPPIARQEEYLRVVNQLSHVTLSEESVTAEAGGLFQSLCQRAFAGEL